MVDIVSVISQEAAHLDIGTGTAPIFVHGTKSYHNLSADQKVLTNGIVFVTEPITSDDKPEITGAYTEKYAIAIFFGLKMVQAQMFDFDAQRVLIMKARLLRKQFIDRIKKRTEFNTINSVKTVELLNEFDANISGVLLYFTAEVTNGDAACVINYGIFSDVTAYCIDADAVLLSPSPYAGGIFTGDGVLPDSGNYYFVPSEAGAGTHIVYYAVYGITYRQIFTVYALPTLTGIPSTISASDSPIQLTTQGQPSGGYYTANSDPAHITEFNPALYNKGLNHISYYNGNGCGTVVNITIT